MTTVTDKPHFRVSPRVLGPLGAEQLQDPALAVLELIKNSWDADAKRVAVAVDGRGQERRIVVLDDGHGMARADFEAGWLVIGASRKRGRAHSEGGRPLIGEKGLGRLATFALGRTVRIESARKGGPGFAAEVNWEELTTAPSLEEYEVRVKPTKRGRGTRVEIRDLIAEWNEQHTAFLVRHAEFLASVPSEKFTISLRVNGKRQVLEDPVEAISRFAEAEMEVEVGEDGTPEVMKCTVAGADETGIVFRPIKPEHKDRRLAGFRLKLKFFRRDEAIRQLSGALERNEVTEVLERYQGVRIFRDGINVPPYGLNGDDWAALEKQRTATGGPTMVPGNSQLVGEAHISRKHHPHLVITAGRAGFADQGAVAGLANYVRWAVREFGTARRAAKLGLTGGDVPARVDDRRSEPQEAPEAKAREALTEVLRSKAVQKDPDLRRAVASATQAVSDALDRNEEALRLYAQLASTGIAATSFAHELRTDFDVISEALEELSRGRTKPDKELLTLLNESWSRLRAFAALFKVIPVKLRRQRRTVSPSHMKQSAEAVLGLAAPGTKAQVITPDVSAKIVHAEFDSILLNLVSNAVKAINESPNRDSGSILVTVTARASDLDIKVADNGCGISPRVAAVMFEPLEGKFAEGTGMGLPITKFIAERYKGRVVVSAKPPKGFVTEISATLRDVVG